MFRQRDILHYYLGMYLEPYHFQLVYQLGILCWMKFSEVIKQVGGI